MEYTFTQLLGMLVILVVCPCSIILTVTYSIIAYKQWEARGFKKKEKRDKHERRQLNG
jgi:hypothetical protein